MCLTWITDLEHWCVFFDNCYEIGFSYRELEDVYILTDTL